MNDVVIVGGGIFGGAAYRLAKQAGASVKVLECGMPESGSKASGNLTKPEWAYTLNEPGKEGLALLEQHFGMEKVTFRLPVGHVSLCYVPHSQFAIPEEDLVREQAIDVKPGVVYTQSGAYEGNVLVAAGVWSGALVQMPPIQALSGLSLHFRMQVPEPRMTLWAPYKQAMSYVMESGETWFGDGTAVKRENLNEGRIKRTYDHAAQHGLTGPCESVVGHRPYVKGHKGFFSPIYDKVWVSTGGAKMGIVLAAYQAQQFVRAIGG